MGTFIRLLCWAVLAGAIIGCRPQAPAANSFTQPAVGTLMPGGHEESVHPNLAPDQSGALVINQTKYSIQIAVSSTITTLPIGQDFLFMLPPRTYVFYIYEPDSAPLIQKETLEGGKLRYLYITRLVPAGARR